MSQPPLVRVANLSRVYQAGGQAVSALRQVDLIVAPGTLVALKGRSGSGKTTLLNCIGGLDQPTTGQVYFGDQEVTRLPERDRTRLRRDQIGFIFQSFALVPIFSAWENVDLVLRIANFSRQARAARIQTCLELVGLADRATHRPYELSGGQQQRVAIARALACRPPLILADEPTGELDSDTGRQILALLHRIVAEEGTTILIATHDPTVQEYASVVYELVDGRVV